jgi:hypothetical protein
LFLKRFLRYTFLIVGIESNEKERNFDSENKM